MSLGITDMSLIKQLSTGLSANHGTDLITLYIPGGAQISKYTQKLVSEFTTSQNIKDKTIRNSVQSSIKSGLALLKTCGIVSPQNGIVLCAGEIKSYI